MGFRPCYVEEPRRLRGAALFPDRPSPRDLLLCFQDFLLDLTARRGSTVVDSMGRPAHDPWHKFCTTCTPAKPILLQQVRPLSLCDARPAGMDVSGHFQEARTASRVNPYQDPFVASLRRRPKSLGKPGSKLPHSSGFQPVTAAAVPFWSPRLPASNRLAASPSLNPSFQRA